MGIRFKRFCVSICLGMMSLGRRFRVQGSPQIEQCSEAQDATDMLHVRYSVYGIEFQYDGCPM